MTRSTGTTRDTETALPIEAGEGGPGPHLT